MKLKRAIWFAAGAASVLAGGSALAQTEAGPAVGSGGEVTEVVVTARRRDEALQDVPVAITAFSGSELARSGVTRFDDLPQVAAGLAIQPTVYGTPAPTIRSQRQPLTNLSYDPSVNIYFADVVEERAHGLNGALYDLSGVQILKGPQGTLFGRNSTGGAVLITPRAPGREFGGYGRLTLGDYNLRMLEGALNLPLSDKVQLRLSGRLTDRDGYTHSITTDRDFADDRSSAARVSLSLQPMDGLTNAFVFDWNNIYSAGSASKLVNVYPGSIADRTYRLGVEQARLAAADFHSTGIIAPANGERIHSYTLSNTTRWDIGDNIYIKNIFGYRKLKSYLNNDFDGSSAVITETYETMDVEQLTNELQLLGETDGGALNYIIGAYYFRESGENFQQTITLGAPSNNFGDITNTSKSVFGQATYKLPFAPQVSLTAGARYTWDERELDSRSTRLGTCAILTADVGGVPISPCLRHSDPKFDKLTYNLSADWHPTKDVLLYAATRRGYRSGGVTWSAKLPADFVPFRPEVVTDYEVGLKTSYRVFGGYGATNVAAYYQDYKNVQRNLNLSIVGERGIPFTTSKIVNAASAKIPGVEIEQSWRMSDLVDVRLSYAYSAPEYRTFVVRNAAGVPQDYSGAPFSGAPKHMLSGSVRVRLLEPEGLGRVYAAINGSYRSGTVVSDVTSYDPVAKAVYPAAKLAGYSVGNLRVEWEEAFGRRLNLSAYVNNFTDEEYYIAGSDIQALGTTALHMGEPRTVGVELTYDF